MRQILKIAAMLLAATSVIGQIGISDRVTTPARSGSWRWPIYKLERERIAVALPAPPAMSTTKRFSDRLKKERTEQTLQASGNEAFFKVYIFDDSKAYTFTDFAAEHTADFKWDATTERQVKVNGASGQEFKAKDGKSMAQVFVNDDRFYAFVIWGTGATDEQRKPFFSSIELGKDLDGVEVSEVPGATLYAEPVTDVYKGGDVDQRVRLRSKPEPQYTVKARSKEVRGGVVLRAVLTGDGRVVNIRVLKSLPYRMTEAAVEAARKIKFDPAVKDGKPVSAWVQLEYHFNIF